MSEYYIEFGLMANSIELTRARVNVGHFHQYDLNLGQKWLPEGNGITRSSFEKNKLGRSKTKKYYCQNAFCYKTCGNHINSNWHACSW